MVTDKARVPIAATTTDVTAIIEALGMVVRDWGFVSGPAPPGTNGFNDSLKKWELDLYKDCMVRIVKGSGVGQSATILSNSRDSLVVAMSWELKLDQTSVYVIYHPKVSSEVIGILALLENTTYGLAVLKVLIDAIENKLDSGVFGLAVLKGLAAAADTKVSYTEDTASGATANVYADALDIDTRGTKSFSAVVKNTDAANSLDWRLRARPSSYTAGADEEIPECPGEETLASGEKGLVELIKSYSRIKIQVKSTLPGTPAGYTVDYLVNR